MYNVKKLIINTIAIYLKHFTLFIKIIAPLILPILVLRLLSPYLYLGKLSVAFTAVFGTVLACVGLFVEILLIKGSYQLAHSIKTAREPVSLKSLWQGTVAKFLPYLTLKIIVGIIIFSIPLLLWVIKKSFAISSMTSSAFTVINIAWIISITLLFLFCTYSLIIEKEKVGSALNHGVNLFLKKPFNITSTLILSTIFFGIIFIILATLTNFIIGIISGELYLLMNPYLSPWWQFVVIDFYALLGVPLLIILTSSLFGNLTKEEEAK